MTNQEKLVEHYERNLEKVKIMHNPKTAKGATEKETCKEYIAYAEKQLEEVKNGRGW